MDNLGTHSFIKFPPDYGKQRPSVWFLLGEIEGKLSALSSAPIPPTVGQDLRLVYQTKGVHATTAIEGNSFSEADVKRIIAGELTAPPSLKYQQTEIENMLQAFNAVGDLLLEGATVAFDIESLNELHRMVLAGLGESTEDHVRVGELRSDSVLAGRYLAPPARDCPGLLSQYCNWLNCLQNEFSERDLALKVVDAIVAHVYFAWIHPYGDGNGRMARLIEFVLLLQAGVPDIAAHLLSNHYHRTRDRYYRLLQESHGEWREDGYAAVASLDGFIFYALEGFRDGLNEQQTAIDAMQMRSIWRDEVDGAFRREFGDRLSAARKRQKRLLLQLGDVCTSEPVRRNEIRQLTLAQAIAYDGKSMRTVQRDLNALLELGLLKREGDGYVPNKDILRVFAARSRANGD